MRHLLIGWGACFLFACGDDVKTEYVTEPAGTYGAIANLQADGLQLRIDGVPTPIGNGATSFVYPAGDAGPHSVEIAQQPTNQACKVDGSNIDCNDRASCKAIHADMPAVGSGIYRIDADGFSGLDPFNAYCDMQFSDGGWTMIEATGQAAMPRNLPSGSPAPNKPAFLPFVVMQALANGASQVHIRTQDNVDKESITSQPDNEVIANLRLGHVLNVGLDTLPADQQVARWTGPNAVAARLSFECLTTAGAWPDVYWACGNQHGFHLIGTQSRWNYSGSNEILEVYVR